MFSVPLLFWMDAPFSEAVLRRPRFDEGERGGVGQKAQKIRDNTMDDKLTYIPKDQNNPLQAAILNQPNIILSQ